MAQYAISRCGSANPEVIIGEWENQVRYEIDTLSSRHYVPIEIQAQLIAQFHAVRYVKQPYKTPLRRPAR